MSVTSVVRKVPPLFGCAVELVGAAAPMAAPVGAAAETVTVAGGAAAGGAVVGGAVGEDGSALPAHAARKTA